MGKLLKFFQSQILVLFCLRLLFSHVQTCLSKLKGVFSLSDLSQGSLDPSSEMSLTESGFEPGKRNFLQLTDKDGEQPQIASVSEWGR